MNMISYIIIAILLLTTVIFFFSNKNMKKVLNTLPFSSNLSMETKYRDMDLVYNSIHRCFLKIFIEFASKDFQFSSPKDLKLYSGRYRELIKDLIRPDVKLERYESDGKAIETTLFEHFIKKVYLMYISETPENIKKLAFNYYSGYNISNYFLKKKPKPSSLGLITEYVRNKLWIMFSNSESEEQALLEQVYLDNPDKSKGFEEYDKTMAEYDRIKLRKINILYYHMTDTSEEWNRFVNPSSNSYNNEEPKETDKKEKKNTFKTDFKVKQ